MGKLAVAHKDVAHQGSGHAAPGPPAVSGMLPPVAPPSPTPYTPAPFMYIARAARLIPSTASRQTKYKKKKIVKVGTCMDIEEPANHPAKPCEHKPPNGADLMSKVAVGLAKVTGPGNKGHVMIKTSEVCTTGADVVLNIPTEKNTVHQSQSKLLDAGGLIAIWDKGAVNPAKVVVTGDPVAVASGEVVDDVTDFEMRGVFDLAWTRHYASGRNRESGPLGRGGWTHAFHQRIEDRGDQLVLHDENGRTLPFPSAAARSGVLLRSRELTLTRKGADHYEVRSRPERMTRTFTPVPGSAHPVLTRIRDDFGNYAELDYDKGKLARVIDTARREARLIHDAKGRIVRVELHARAELRQWVDYAYSDDGDLASVTNALGEVAYYTYDAQHRLVEKRLRSGLRFAYTYDRENDRCTRSTGPELLQNVVLKLDGPRRVVVTGNPEPREYEFDARGNMTSVMTFGGTHAARFEYDDDELVTRQINAAGDEIVYTYDDEGRLVAEEGPGDRKVELTYAGELLVKIVDGAETTAMTWDHRGALESVTYPDGVVIHYEIDRNGRVVRTHGPEGPLDAYEYDSEHNLVCVTDARGAKVRTEYDALGMPTLETDALGKTMRTEYDALGRPVRRIMHDGTLIELVYDANDDVVASGDGAAAVQKIERGGTGVVVRRTLADGQAWEMAYDVLERLREIKNPKGEIYEYRYDRAGRLVEEHTFDGQTLRYTYSTRDVLSRIDYDDDTWVELDHDAMGLLIEKRSPHGTVTFERDVMGNVMVASVDEHGGAVVVEIERNERGQVTRETRDGLAVEYTYDVMGRVASRTLPGGAVTRYFYDPCGALVGVDHAGKKMLIQRDLLGRERRRHVYESGFDLHSEWNDDDRMTSQVASRTTTPGAEPETLVRRAYTYGAHARVRTIVDTLRGTTSFRHDAIGQLCDVQRPDRAESYGYDPSGSLVRAGSEGEPWAVRMGNVLVRTERARYEYDVRRRRRAREAARDAARAGRTEYVWDCNDQLREAKLPSGVRVLFKYDAFGRRVRKSVLTPSEDPTQPPTVRTVDYVWDFAELAMEIDSERGERVFIHERDTFSPLLQVERGETYAYVTDAIGATKELVDDAGRIAWAVDHTAWGGVTKQTRAPGSDVTSPFGLLGHYLDDETGLAYALNRYFDPEVSRWLSADPLGFEGGPNLYAFDGSPTERVDPLGLMTKTQFQSFLNKYRQKRIDAQRASMKEQSAIGDRGRWVSGSANNKGNKGRSGTPRPASDKHRPDKNIHAEEQVIKAGGSGNAIGAGRPHCANCTNDVINSGNVPATSIRPSWEPTNQQLGKKSNGANMPGRNGVAW